LLVILGGSDPDNRTAAVLDALLAHCTLPLEITTVLGPANPREGELRQRFGSRVRIQSNVKEMLTVMQEADLVLSSGGSTVWELALLARPMLLGAMSEVENLLAKRVEQAKACVYIGHFDDLEPSGLATEVARVAADLHLRQGLGARATSIVDGQGAARVVAAMRAMQAQPSSNGS
jgi:UDP-2,4-diacetamido-2,4,6-trideoxy-beta-L-altropyranose hydrolase